MRYAIVAYFSLAAREGAAQLFTFFSAAEEESWGHALRFIKYVVDAGRTRRDPSHRCAKIDIRKP